MDTKTALLAVIPGINLVLLLWIIFNHLREIREMLTRHITEPDLHHALKARVKALEEKGV